MRQKRKVPVILAAMMAAMAASSGMFIHESGRVERHEKLRWCVCFQESSQAVRELGEQGFRVGGTLSCLEQAAKMITLRGEVAVQDKMNSSWERRREKKTVHGAVDRETIRLLSKELDIAKSHSKISYCNHKVPDNRRRWRSQSAQC